MGRKTTALHKMFDEVDISSTQTSEASSVLGLDYCTIHVTWSGSSPVGTITVEATNDRIDTTDTPVYRELDFGATISVSGNSGEHDLVINELSFNAIRIKYTSSSGTGTMTARLVAKVKGA